MSSVPPTSDARTGAAAPSMQRQAPHHSHERTEREREPAPTGHGPFVPLLLLALAVVLWPAYQAVQLNKERQNLATVFANQKTQYDTAVKLRTSLDTVARDTATLASNGNADAKLIVQELAKRGITINPNAPAAEPPTADR